MLDPLTLLVVSAFTLAVAAALILVAWLQHRHVTALVLWSSAFGLGAVATMLILMRGHVPSFWSVSVANTVLALAYGLLWSGARLFDDRRALPILAALGAAAWLAAYAQPEFHANPTYRAVIMAGIGTSYTLAAAFELWRNRRDCLRYRWPVIGLLLLHAIAVPLRIPLAGAPLTPIEITEVVSFVMFETVLLSMCCAYLLPGLVNERVTAGYRHDARRDPLTGINNRRTFVEQGKRIVMRCVMARQPVALLLFDLDHFKQINDAYGHATGDKVLIDFCRLVEAQLRPVDLFARLGGEEFACLLPDVRLQAALAVAERLRIIVAEQLAIAADHRLHCSVSIGLSASSVACDDLSSLLLSADRALYRAKQAGRNRCEIQDDPAVQSTSLAAALPYH